ncbi:DUF188 domain-containing protein [Treponema sp.]|uniref:YaiI/YqxD family protein n=1 Tax=Treponema sp. TaxID=166 RepID=UPI00298E6E7D|nr:DUF188 domain-containing protein [Treponema sp.]MCR5613737.1 DUF188 domain-containing protein [Treponema sp.]
MDVKIWVDADSCPRLVRTYLVDYALKLKTKIFFVANKNIPCPNSHELFSMFVTDTQSQAADDYISENATSNDIVITRDILLADRLVEKQITVLNDRGTLWTKENIKERKSERDFSMQLTMLGLGGDKKNAYSKKEFAQFANCFDREIHRLLKK